MSVRTLKWVSVITLVMCVLFFASGGITSGESRDFSEEFKEPFNWSAWHIDVNAPIKAHQKDGHLCFSGSGGSDGGKFWASPRQFSEVPLDEIGAFETRFILAADHTGGWVDITMALGADAGGGWRGASCRIRADEEHRPSIECQVPEPKTGFSIIKDTSYDKWHTLRIEVERGIPKVFFFLDGEYWGSQKPRDVVWSASNAKFTAGIGAFRSAGSFATTCMDDVLVRGNPELSRTAPEPGAGIELRELGVPGDYDSIQKAIDASQDGDAIIVAAGRYKENLNFLGKDITLRSEAGPEDTILDGGQWGSVVAFVNGETATLEGFTITNGLFQIGGGIRIWNASPTIKNNVITRNGAMIGGGIYVEGEKRSTCDFR